MGNHPYKHKYDTCEHTLQTLRNVDELKRFNPIRTFIDKYKAFDVEKLTGAMKFMESSQQIPDENLIRYAEDINLPRISLVINLQDMLSMAMALKLNHNENMINVYNDTTKELLNDVTEIINRHQPYVALYEQDHNDLISVEKMLRSEMKLREKLGNITF